jgi:hypothetical protein
MTNYDVIKKLLGPINPVGETRTDDERFQNLEETIKVVNSLLFDISQVAVNVDRQEYSMSRAGKTAVQFLKEVWEETDVKQFEKMFIETKNKGLI